MKLLAASRAQNAFLDTLCPLPTRTIPLFLSLAWPNVFPQRVFVVRKKFFRPLENPTKKYGLFSLVAESWIMRRSFDRFGTEAASVCGFFFGSLGHVILVKKATFSCCCRCRRAKVHTRDKPWHLPYIFIYCYSRRFPLSPVKYEPRVTFAAIQDSHKHKPRFVV